MSDWEEAYEAFVEKMEAAYPKMLEEGYGGFCIGEGWYPIVESLCKNIQRHIDWRNETRERLLKSNPYDHEIPEEVPQVIVQQIKEKFGGLRFYCRGGDDTIRGMIEMAEAWAEHACEKCGKPGQLRSGGWMQTLCDEHEVERQERMNKIDEE